MIKNDQFDFYVKAQKAICINRLNYMQQLYCQYLQKIINGMTVSGKMEKHFSIKSGTNMESFFLVIYSKVLENYYHMMNLN